jgi:monoterpene epsilon-lactone hydrolase
MPSLRARLVRWIIRRMFRPGAASEAALVAGLARPKRSHVPPDRLRRAHAVVVGLRGDLTTYAVSPRRGPIAREVVFLHGGGYVGEIFPEHWRFVADLADRAAARVHVLVYPLAPAHTAADAIPRVLEAWRALSAERPALTLVGDSAGGGLALALTRLALDAGLPAPRRLALLSPWVELDLEAPDALALAPDDPMIDVRWLRLAARAWAGSWPLDDPRVSPLHAEPGGLPPTLFVLGEHDVLTPDAERLAACLRDAGVTVDVHVEPGLFHVYPLAPVPEAEPARRRIAAWLAADTHVGAATRR